MIQIKSLIPLSGVHVETEQLEGFVAFDEGKPKHLFRVYAKHMEDDEVKLHLNTDRDHQCVLKVKKRSTRADTVVTIDFPQTHAAKAASLPRSLRQSDVRQIWYAQWGNGGHDAIATASCTVLKEETESIVGGTRAELVKRCSVPGFVGYTYTITNTSPTTLSFASHGFTTPTRKPHSSNLTDVEGNRHNGLLKPGEQLCLHLFYETKRRP